MFRSNAHLWTHNLPKVFPVTTTNILDFDIDTLLLTTLTSYYNYQVSQMRRYVEDISEGERRNAYFENGTQVI